jgi:hypothetical protein
MWIFIFIFFIPLTIAFLIVTGICFAYLFMGIRHLSKSRNENNYFKKQGGVISIFISIVILALAIYLYFKWVWLWHSAFS